jgi:hypothetical protein
MSPQRTNELDSFDENPEWTAADFAKSQPASDLPREILAQFPKTKVGSPNPEAAKKRSS